MDNFANSDQLVNWGLYWDKDLKDAVHHLNIQFKNGEDVEITLYFGSSVIAYNMELVSDPEGGLIYLSAQNDVPIWEAEKNYKAGDSMTPAEESPYIFICQRYGHTGKTKPNFDVQRGENVQDGSIIWQNAGLRVKPEHVFLTTTDFVAVNAAQPVELGQSIKNKPENAIKFLIKIKSPDPKVFDIPVSQIALALNDVKEVYKS